MTETWVGFDADDTLWRSEDYYRDAQAAFERIVGGYVDLDRVSHARLRSWYKMGNDEVRIANTSMDGPRANNYSLRANVPLDALPWLSCANSSSAASPAQALT